jgi:integrase
LSASASLFLEDKQCDRLRNLMGEMKFKRGKPRTTRVTPEHAIAIRAQAHRVGRPSIALGQAGMTDFGWRQIDLIGSYDPRGKTDKSDVVVARWGEWLHGLRFEEIDDDLVVHHVTSKKQKLSEPPLAYAPMMLQELRLRFCPNGEPLTRDRMPERGPVIVNEITGVPYSERQWRYEWRKIARAAGVPDDVQNRDSRAGRATHALAMGVPLDRVRQMLGHSKAETTAIYLRDPAGEMAAAMKQIAASA